PEGRAGRGRRAGERAAEDRGGPRLPRSALEGDKHRTLMHGAPVRGAFRDESPLSAGVVEERRRPTPVLGTGRARRPRPTSLDRLALAPVVRHGIGARGEGAVATLGVGFAGQQLPGTAGQDALDRAVVGPGELDDDRPHVGVVGPRAVDLVRWPEDRLAGRDPEALVAVERTAAALDDDEPGHVGVRVRFDPTAAVERQLGHDTAPVAVDDLAADALGASRPARPAVADPEAADLDRHRVTRDLSGGALPGGRSSAGSSSRAARTWFSGSRVVSPAGPPPLCVR